MKENKIRRRPKYKEDIKTAYNVGYSKGWDYAYEIPKRFGSKFVAAIGFSKGVKNRYRSDKYIKRYNKHGGIN